MMRVSVLGFALAVLLVGGIAAAETTTFSHGELHMTWTQDGALTIRTELQEASARDDPSLMWVITVVAQRFADGIHAWQLHLSPAYGSLVVIPNDFLTARTFALDQLGVQTLEHTAGRSLSLQIPRDGPIPGLAAPGDRIELHALWIQQAPLVTAVVPEMPTATSQEEGPEEAAPAEIGDGGPPDAVGGQGAVAADAAADDPPADGAAAPAISENPVPEEASYVRGSIIEHAFLLLDPRTSEPDPWGSATICLLRKQEGEPDEIIRYLYRTPDPETGRIEYSFDTTTFQAGSYLLIVWTTSLDATVNHAFQLIDP